MEPKKVFSRKIPSITCQGPETGRQDRTGPIGEDVRCIACSPLESVACNSNKDVFNTSMYIPEARDKLVLSRHQFQLHLTFYPTQQARSQPSLC